ncbi:LolA family protein [Holophaga foetida]|uniref:LolA family protein n=1 Tax=Holophaga foetida TaxID=35839 RepID=UPI00024749EA|nr:outer membrane lipoprotein carrier protein LolA [Holophaga foetida]
MMMRCLRLAALAVALPLLAQPGSPDLKLLVERFDAAQAKADTIQTPFTLTIRRAMLRTPTVTRGTLYIQGSSFVHFTFAPPEDLVLHLTPKTLISYSPRSREGEILKIGFIKNANRKFLGLGQKLSYLSDYFKVESADPKDLPNTYFLKLLPRSLSMKRRFQAIHIWVDRDTSLPRQVLWIERSGDSWQLELEGVQTNRPIPSPVQAFTLPTGIELRNGFSFFATRKK